MKKIVIALLVFGVVMLARYERTLLAVQSATSRLGARKPVPDAAIQELRAIGITLADAVVKRDFDTLLKYDRPALRSVDSADLQNPRSELYCFVFDSSCAAPELRGSVRDVIVDAKRLDVQ